MLYFDLDSKGKTQPFPHYWEGCIGSGHAAMGLRADWREQLTRCKKELGFEYVRFHGLLCNDMSVYTKHEGSSFVNVNNLFDFLLSIGMKPLVEIGFMPNDLGSGTEEVFHYRGNITPPKDYNQWKVFITELVQNLINRYGLKEVQKWYFEVWNEPNLECFWSSDMQEYFKLYKYTVEAVKSVDENLQVGGPSTARNEWIPELIDYCAENNVALDFISTHHYPTDVALAHFVDVEDRMAKAPRGNMQEMAQKAREETDVATDKIGKPLPLFYTEWNNSPSCRDKYHDKPFCASFLTKSIIDNTGIVDMYSFWTFSDLFEEMPQSSVPFHGGFGLLNYNGIPKPSYWAFKLLHEMGTDRLDIVSPENTNVEALATLDGNVIKVLLYNHNMPLQPIEDEEVTLTIHNLNAIKSATLQCVDDHHSNPRKVWQDMGAPKYLKPHLVEKLKRDTKVIEEDLTYDIAGDNLVVKTTILAHGVSCVTIELG
ncbi:beta-xylosidase [Vallitalea pronyensis]|uniref:Beta-xylosidase n=1 Tax=Vallitalea pronyensis TaxID=1348613 RepID=A0A8J8MK37_9FIRM|nr:beta-xylosidase [Vallitalea pronyensis]QUI22743.1 beta-xylosidase [Vallitalea pronyensis]